MRNRLLQLNCVLAAAIALGASGCAARPEAPRAAPSSEITSTAPAGTEASGSIATQAASATTQAPTPPRVSGKSLAYAKSIGGFDHKGLKLYLIVGGSFGTEAQAQAALDRATPMFGDMQSYFIVQRSDSFAGMPPGSWVVVEAYFQPPSKANLEFARRGFPDSRVKRARVLVSAPIPVYEDLVGGD